MSAERRAHDAVSAERRAHGAAPVPTVALTGRPGGTTHLSVESLSNLPDELRLIGGLAVLCRVGVPHRATVDLDALTRDLEGFEECLSHLALSSAGGGQYVMPGGLDLDVIDVAPGSAQDIVDELREQGPLSDLELNVVANTWAHDEAEPLSISVVDEAGEPLLEPVVRLVARPAGLVAMKAMTVPLRASSKPEKRASDLYDLARLLVSARDVDRISVAPEELSDAVLGALGEWFVDPMGRDRTFREIRRFDEVGLDLGEVAAVAEDLGAF